MLIARKFQQGIFAAWEEKKTKFYRIFRPEWKSGTHLMKTIINQATKFSKEKERTKMMLIH